MLFDAKPAILRFVRMAKYTELIATGLGIGKLPVAPGTWASVATLPFGYIIASTLGPVALGVVAIVLTGVGIWVSDIVVKARGDHDPRDVVIDEIAGQALALVPAALDPLNYIVAFGLFRFFDIGKLWPANAAQKLPGGYGVVIDDVVAGIYAAIGVWAGAALGLW
jgi:phosphatidylglycerophosphatase A